MRSNLNLVVGGFCAFVVSCLGQLVIAQEAQTNLLALRGIVVDANNQPVPTPIIELVQTKDRIEIGVHQKNLNVISNADGTFEVTDLPQGIEPVFKITDSQDKRVGYLHLDELDKVKSQNDLKALRIVVEEGTTVRGKVLNNGNPYPDFQVSLRLEFGRTVGPNRLISNDFVLKLKATTNDAGEYLFENVAPKKSMQISVRKSAGGYLRESSITPKPGDERWVKDLNFETLNKRVSGFVVDYKGDPVRGARISFMNSSGQQFKIDEIVGGKGEDDHAKRVTDKQGRFTASELPAGKLSLWAHPPRVRTSEGGFRRMRSAHFDVISGQSEVRIVLDQRLGRAVKKRE
jgi:hypothetical protein